MVPYSAPKTRRANVGTRVTARAHTSGMEIRHLPPPNVTITVKNVDARVLRRLADQARIEGMSQQAWIRRALTESLRNMTDAIGLLRRTARLSGGLSADECRILMARHAERSLRNSLSAHFFIERAHRRGRGLAPLPTKTLCLKGIHPVMANEIVLTCASHGVSEQELLRQIMYVTAMSPTQRETEVDA